MTELAFDVLEQILIRLDVKDLIRCKSVYKSWKSFISSPRFVKAHLNHNIKSDRDNQRLGHRRIRICYGVAPNLSCIVGSCNGLVCIYPIVGEFLVINPSTREEKKLQTLPNEFEEATIRRLITWGFGYDSYSDDYKVVVGLETPPPTRFHVLSLKSNTWKVIGESKYHSMGGNGILCDGVLYWFMANIKLKKLIIISFDLSTEELKKIPQPDDVDYKTIPKTSPLFKHTLGLIQDRLCIYSKHSSKIWVMVNNKWEQYIDRQQSKYDIANRLSVVSDSQNKRGYVYTFRHDDGQSGHRAPCNGKYMCSSIFVKSLSAPFDIPLDSAAVSYRWYCKFIDG
ncbi:F-box/kelch-repeat protein At2g43270-like [Bidens hawaiensis]|uniref:F-box/kelch-repeat protein At2g43270-like n=1 Tax=Bidens hawaiensis TaxID=980011 RepID=UPI004049F459